MTDSRSRPAPRAPTPRHVVVHWWGMAILFAGLLAAVLLYALAPEDGAGNMAAIAGAKMYQHNLALIGGNAAVAADRFNRWFDSLWHGRPLACTIAVLAIAIAAVFFWVAHVMSIPLPARPDKGNENSADRG